MTRKKTMIITSVLYIFCAVLWAANFLISWREDGRLMFSTVLFGVSAVCFMIAAVLNIIRMRRMGKDANSKEE